MHGKLFLFFVLNFTITLWWVANLIFTEPFLSQNKLWIEGLSLPLILVLWVLTMRLGRIANSFSEIEGQIISYEKAMDYQGPFFLLLRSFHSESVYDLRVYESSIDPDNLSEIKTYTVPTVEKVEAAIRDKAMLVAIGGKSPFIVSVVEIKDTRMTILTSDDNDWKKRVELFMHYCKAILLLPETTKGVLEEIQIIKQKNYWKKTIVIMPPLLRVDTREATGLSSISTHGRGFAQWENLSKELAVYGYNLPDASESGMAFTINDDLSAKDIIPLDTSQGSDWGLASALDKLLKDECEWIPLRDIDSTIASTLQDLTLKSSALLPLASAAQKKIVLGYSVLGLLIIGLYYLKHYMIKAV